MPADATPELPGLCWTEGQTLLSKGGAKLRRWGNVQAACKILDDCERHVIYDLVEAKAIKGYKLKPHVSNSHWKIDLLSVWEHKQRQIHAA